LKSLDSGACPGLRSGIHRNDDSWAFSTFYEAVKDEDFSFSGSIAQGERQKRWVGQTLT